MSNKAVRILCNLLAAMIVLSVGSVSLAGGGGTVQYYTPYNAGDNFEALESSDNMISITVNPNTSIASANTTLDVKMSVSQLSGGANVISGTLSVTDNRFDVGVLADYPNATAIYNPGNGNFSLFTLGEFIDDAEAALMTIRLSLKQGETLNNGDTVSVILNSVNFQYTVSTIPCVIVNGTATTIFGQQYLPYDLNNDGVVDLNDITFALQYLLVTPSDLEWAIAYACDFNGDNIIGIEDLAVILANYTVPYY